MLGKTYENSDGTKRKISSDSTKKGKVCDTIKLVLIMFTEISIDTVQTQKKFFFLALQPKLPVY